MTLRSFLPNDLSDLEFAQPTNQPRTQHQADDSAVRLAAAVRNVMYRTTLNSGTCG